MKDTSIICIIVPGRSRLEYFQKGVLMTNSSLRQLYVHLQTKYKVDFMLTNPLNQDSSQHFLERYEARGEFTTVLQLKHLNIACVNMYILGRHLYNLCEKYK